MSEVAHHTDAKLVVTRDDRAAQQVVTLRGQIDDDAHLEGVATDLDRPVVVDLEGITFMNSLGVRAWVLFLDALRQRNIPVTLRRCAETVVDHMNMIMEARGHAGIESFYAPYTCDACGLETRALLEVSRHGEALRRHQPPQLPCSACGGTMSYDDIPNRSLLFLD